MDAVEVTRPSCQESRGKGFFNGLVAGVVRMQGNCLLACIDHFPAAGIASLVFDIRSESISVETDSVAKTA